MEGAVDWGQVPALACEAPQQRKTTSLSEAPHANARASAIGRSGALCVSVERKGLAHTFEEASSRFGDSNKNQFRIIDCRHALN